MNDLTMTELTNAPVPAVSPAPVPARGGDGAGWRARLNDLMTQPAVARSLPLIGLIALAGIVGMMWLALREAPQRDLFRGLPDGDKAAVVEVLGKNNIPYKLDSSSGAITVAEDDYFNAKMMLAAEGLPKSAPDGNALIDSLPMGASRAVEGEKLRGARETDLARTIEAIDSVEKARVHLAVEPPSIFLRERTRPSASVMLRLTQGRALSESQVQAIVHLVASSVPDLAPESVSVVDQNGRLLSGRGGGQGETDRQLSVQAQIEERYRQQVVALLTPIVGAGKFSAEVHAEVNFTERQATRETYPQEEARLRVEQGSWQAGNPNAPAGATEAGGIPGALSNQAPPAATAGTQAGAVQQATGQSATANGQATPPVAPVRTQESYNRSFELGREVAVIRDAVGTVRRVSVAVALDNDANGKPRSAAEIAALEQLVKGAVGFDVARGDTVALSARSFVKEAPVETPWYEAGWLSTLARNLSALAVVAVLIFGIGRPMLKRRAEAMQEAAAERAAAMQRVGKEIADEMARTAPAMDTSGRVTLDMISSTPDYAQRAGLIRNFVKQDPDRAALVVRDLLKEGKAKENA